MVSYRLNCPCSIGVHSIDTQPIHNSGLGSIDLTFSEIKQDNCQLYSLHIPTLSPILLLPQMYFSAPLDFLLSTLDAFQPPCCCTILLSLTKQSSHTGFLLSKEFTTKMFLSLSLQYFLVSQFSALPCSLTFCNHKACQ